MGRMNSTEPTPEMAELQDILMETARDIHSALEAEGIPYYVLGGAVIGCMRIGRLVPWDDDIDIAVWSEDIPEINRVMIEELDPDKYYYHVPSADTHPHVIAKCGDLERGLADRNAPFIDLFPISAYPSKRLRAAFYWLFTWGNVGSVWALDHFKSLTVHRALKWIPSFFGRLAEMTVNKDSDLTTIVSTEFMDYIFPRGYYGEPVMHAFEDTEVPLPKETDAMLTHMFGDYMTPPPEDQRKGSGGFPCSAYKDYKLYGENTGWEE